MHHNKNAVKTKPPVLYQTTIVTFADGKKLGSVASEAYNK